MRRRLLRHHLPLALASALALLAAHAVVRSKGEWFRWSMATAYVGLVLLGATLATGPLKVLRGRPNPVSTDLRRDIGIWAGMMAVAHFLVGWQVHMKHRYLYFFRERTAGGALLPRTDLFGAANDLGLIAVLVAGMLLALSNDRSLRALGTPRWKSLQRWNYGLLALVLAHGAAFQLIEKRAPPFVALFAALSAAIIVLQLVGYRRRRRADAARETT